METRGRALSDERDWETVSEAAVCSPGPHGTSFEEVVEIGHLSKFVVLVTVYIIQFLVFLLEVFLGGLHLCSMELSVGCPSNIKLN
jgi:hypothetical protein